MMDAAHRRPRERGTAFDRTMGLGIRDRLRALAPGLPIALALMVASTGAAAATKEIKLPAETARLRPSTLPGYALAAQKCVICHSVDYIEYQPPGMNQAQWTGEVAKMQRAFGAPLSEDEVNAIGAYLAVAYGSAKATDAGVLAASRGATPSTTAAGRTTAAAATDVQALLNANACLACHAIDRKVVGPAYRDVAAKYKGDAQALAKVQASIRQGGVGKWGQVQMPPNAGLSAAQVKALAEFVLQQ